MTEREVVVAALVVVVFASGVELAEDELPVKSASPEGFQSSEAGRPLSSTWMGAIAKGSEGDRLP